MTEQESNIKENTIEVEGDFDDNTENEVSVDFDIAAYPADLTLSVIRSMWENKEIIIPGYQRNFVWSKKQASLLIESFLIGLPVPQVFLYVNDDNKYEVIDGQQRITSIIYYFSGFFGEENEKGKRETFRLTNLDTGSPYFNKRFEDLEDTQRRRLEGAVLRAINIKQIKPAGESTISYHIFERLNTGGTTLKPQEIRNCVYRGGFRDHLKELNGYKGWRKMIGKPKEDKFQKDVEMILRLFCLVYRFDEYVKPMKEFLNVGMLKHSIGSTKEVIEFLAEFPKVIDFINANMGKEKPFHLRGPLNLPALEAVFLACYGGGKDRISSLSDAAAALFEDKDFYEYSRISTSDKTVIESRLKLSRDYLYGAG